MNRRESLGWLSTLAAQAMFPSVLERFAAAVDAPVDGADTWRPEFLSPDQGRVLAEVVETIIPTTDTPGATSARVHVFIDLMLKDCVAVPEQGEVRQVLDTLGADFVASSTAERTRRLQQLDSAGFRLLKELTLLGYFTSKVGATQALAYVAVPGEYQGCIELAPRQRTWATR